MTDPKYIIGIDEAGRGALAGPLVVGAAAFRREDPIVTVNYRGLRSDRILTAGDSKSFDKPVHREALDLAIRGIALTTAVVERSNTEIDARLMYAVFPEAIKLCIARCLEQLKNKGFGDAPSDYLVLVDGDLQIDMAGIPAPVREIVGGDKRVWQIGAASIIAKVYRDGLMAKLHEEYPAYGFDKHKGYPVPNHKKVLKELGPSPIHRRTYRPVAEAQGLPPGFEI